MFGKRRYRIVEEQWNDGAILYRLEVKFPLWPWWLSIKAYYSLERAEAHLRDLTNFITMSAVVREYTR